ncbi:MAG TPA: LysM peptidoglycan-binding domain-containing protein [Planctomycetota bacterium]|nr:LysM peptidoglycan-binding domain-containing protein [Planctomycetota bacterium]
MKRDARIGLAVVLVLGLAVTLLVGRAIVKGNPDADAEPEAASAGGPAAYSTEIARVDGAPTGHVAASAGAPVDTAAAAPQLNPAVQRFVDDQTRNISAEAPSPVNPLPAPAPASNRVQNGDAAPGKTPAANKPAPVILGPAADSGPRQDHSDALDHESTGPAGSNDSGIPADGYGYTVAAGDNMWKISSKVFGDGKFTQKIVEANPGLNSAKMKPGMIIKIPVIQNKTVLMKLPSFAEASKQPSGSAVAAAKEKEVKKDAPASAQPIAASSSVKAEKNETLTEATTHKVEAGETLGTIAKKYYGFSGPKSIARITSANKGLDPAKLKVGQEIAIPAAK